MFHKHEIFFFFVCMCEKVEYFKGTLISGAFHLAVEDVNLDENLLSGYEMNYIFENTCQMEISSLLLSYFF